MTSATSPTHQCTIVPKEVCVLKFNTPKPVSKPLLTKWCLDTENTEERSSEIGKFVCLNVYQFLVDMIWTNLVTGEGSEGRSNSISKPNFTDGKNAFNSQSQVNQRGNNDNNILGNKENYGSPSLEQYASDQEQRPSQPSNNYGVNNGRDNDDYDDYSYDPTDQYETENSFKEEFSNVPDDYIATPEQKLKEIYEAPLGNIAIDEGYGAPSEGILSYLIQFTLLANSSI